MLKKLYNFVSFVLGGIFGGVIFYVLKIITVPGFHNGDSLLSNNTDTSMLILSVFSFALIFYTLAPFLVRKVLKTTVSIGEDLRDVSGGLIAASVIGIIAGLIIALLLSMTYRTVLSGGWYSLLTIVLYIVCGYLGFAISVSKFRGSVADGKLPRGAVGAFIESFKGKNHPLQATKIIDTSVLIDGRIEGIMRAGFLDGPLIVPEFVLVELRHIADSSDDLRRTKGRRGLDVLDAMQKYQKVEIFNTNKMKSIEEIPEVDVKLIKLTQAMGGKLLTTDYNLNKVAVINNVKVLNINDLANAIKPVVIPGEKMIVKILKQGKDDAQGIGYLDDGTMIVVEDGRDEIGKDATIRVTSVIQTSAGKMIFGRCNLENEKKEKTEKKKIEKKKSSSKSSNTSNNKVKVE